MARTKQTAGKGAKRSFVEPAATIKIVAKDSAEEAGKLRHHWPYIPIIQIGVDSSLSRNQTIPLQSLQSPQKAQARLPNLHSKVL